MEHLRKLGIVVALMFALGLSASAGYAQTPSCEPGQIPTPPCACAPGEIPSRDEVETQLTATGEELLH